MSSIIIPNTITSIGYNTFQYCRSLKNVDIPNSVTSIGSYSFKECSSLTSIIIPNSVTLIRSYAFDGCSNIESFIIGSGIKTIGENAFSNCQKLKDVYCYAKSIPTTKNNVFENSYIEYTKLHVPAASMDAYNSVEPWADFEEIVALTDDDPKPDATGINVVRNTEGNKSIIYNLNGVRQTEPQKGINIVNGKKYVVK